MTGVFERDRRLFLWINDKKALEVDSEDTIALAGVEDELLSSAFDARISFAVLICGISTWRFGTGRFSASRCEDMVLAPRMPDNELRDFMELLPNERADVPASCDLSTSVH